MSVARHAHTATRLASGKVLVAGGSTGSTSLSSAELYDPSTNTWSPALAMSQARAWPTATQLVSGDVLVAGGSGFDGEKAASAEIYGLAPLGAACVLNEDCGSGFCTDGVCCDTACNAGPCDACSTAAGAPVNGTCALVTGPACDDGDACTQVDTCQAGVCAGASPVVCPAPDACHEASVCDPQTGKCAAPVDKADGAPCDDGNACTLSDTCKAGTCIGADPVNCGMPDQCHAAGACDPATGMCPVKADGAACDDGDVCTQGETCQAGACTNGEAVVCTALDTCHVAGQCDKATGVCTNPAKPDTAACDGGTCKDGVCVSLPSSGSGGDGGNGGGCGCSVGGSRASGGLWVVAGLLLAMRRKRARTPETTSSCGPRRSARAEHP
jgi:MYXO-CTERM domain-containing protein